MRIAALVSAWLCAAAVVASFFLPWFEIRVQGPEGLTASAQPDATAADDATRALLALAREKMGRVVATVRQDGQTVSGELPGLEALPEQVRGVDIPVLANQEDAKLMLALASTMTASPSKLAQRSWLVYGFPGLAIVVVLLTTFLPRAVVSWVAALVCIGLAVAVHIRLPSPSDGPGWISFAPMIGLQASLAGLCLIGALAVTRASLYRR